MEVACYMARTTLQLRTDGEFVGSATGSTHYKGCSYVDVERLIAVHVLSYLFHQLL